METKYGALELLLVSADGLQHAHHLGTQRHYATIQFGNRILTSKITRGKGKKVWWNEKFRFPVSSDECKELAKVTVKIIERDKFSEDSQVGETRVHVGDIIVESAEREFLQMKPAPYSIVLEDGTYKGKLKLGLKFLSKVSLEYLEQSRERRQCIVPPYRPFLKIALPGIPWRRLFFFCTRSDDNGGSRRNS